MESGFVDWVVQEFRHSVPSEYRDFLFRDAAAAHAEPMALDCDERSKAYGRVLLQAPEGYFDEARQENVYEEPVLLARSFSDVLAALSNDGL